jgi:hypothetical protein
MNTTRSHAISITSKAKRAEIFKQWAANLTTAQLETKRDDMPYEVRRYRDEECRAVESELNHR